VDVRALVQTVSRASVTVGDEVVGKIEDGLLVLLGVNRDDTAATAAELARKTYELRILDDEASASDLGAPVLVVSQFTLYGDARKGRRPSWSDAAPAGIAEPLVMAYVDALRARGATVETGRFRAHMLVESVNVGPRTLLLEL
jgi:D-tyrosyl-tRNA(Tyr) deacylase